MKRQNRQKQTGLSLVKIRKFLNAIDKYTCMGYNSLILYKFREYEGKKTVSDMEKTTSRICAK